MNHWMVWNLEKFLTIFLLILVFAHVLLVLLMRGGIDIIAYYEGLVFKGKYLIQCKRLKGKAGEARGT